jgi:hypothetical protein
VDLNPENEAVLHELAYCYDLAGPTRLPSCISRRTPTTIPTAAVGWYNLGNVLAKLDRYGGERRSARLRLGHR